MLIRHDEPATQASLTIMFGPRHLIFFATVLALQVTALPGGNSEDDALECYSSLKAYKSSSYAYSTEYTFSTVSVQRSLDTNVPLTTLCDGRARQLEPYKTISATVTKTYNPPLSRTLYTNSGVSPACTIAPSDCTAVLSAHPEAAGVCQTPMTSSVAACTSGIPGYCFIYANPEAILYHWPLVTVSGDFCAQNGSTVTAEPTIAGLANTAVVDDYTFTSPTNYISFGDVHAVLHGTRRQLTSCGPTATNVVLPITEPFYSGPYSGKETYSFNFADLNTVPVEAWTRQKSCGLAHNKCSKSPIEQADYTPVVPLPTEILNLEPEEWKAAGCAGTGINYLLTPVALATPVPTVV